jgi:hypothetical protein
VKANLGGDTVVLCGDVMWEVRKKVLRNISDLILTELTLLVEKLLIM